MKRHFQWLISFLAGSAMTAFFSYVFFVNFMANTMSNALRENIKFAELIEKGEHGLVLQTYNTVLTGHIATAKAFTDSVLIVDSEALQEHLKIAEHRMSELNDKDQIN